MDLVVSPVGRVVKRPRGRSPRRARGGRTTRTNERTNGQNIHPSIHPRHRPSSIAPARDARHSSSECHSHHQPPRPSRGNERRTREETSIAASTPTVDGVRIARARTRRRKARKKNARARAHTHLARASRRRLPTDSSRPRRPPRRTARANDRPTDRATDRPRRSTGNDKRCVMPVCGGVTPMCVYVVVDPVKMRARVVETSGYCSGGGSGCDDVEGGYFRREGACEGTVWGVRIGGILCDFVYVIFDAGWVTRVSMRRVSSFCLVV